MNATRPIGVNIWKMTKKCNAQKYSVKPTTITINKPIIIIEN